MGTRVAPRRVSLLRAGIRHDQVSIVRWPHAALERGCKGGHMHGNDHLPSRQVGRGRCAGRSLLPAIACACLLSATLPSCGSEAVNDFLAFLDGLPADAEVGPAIIEHFDIAPPSFRLRLKNGAETPLPPAIEAATTVIQEVQIVFRRTGSLAEETYIPTTGADFQIVDLMALDSEDGVEVLASMLPDGEVTDVRIVFATGSVRLEGRDIPLGYVSGAEAGIRLTPERRPWSINADTPNNFSIMMDVSRSLVPNANKGFVLAPILRIAGDTAQGIPEMEPAVGVPTVFPAAIRAGGVTDVSVHVRVADPSVNPSTLRLVRVLPDGTTIPMAPLNDGGLAGDTEADDTLYSAVVPIADAPGEMFLRVEGTDLGGRPVRSTTTMLDIAPDGVPITILGRGEAEDDPAEAVFDDLTEAPVSPRVLGVRIAPGTPFADIQRIVGLIDGTVVGRVPEINVWQVEFLGDGTADDAWAAAAVLLLEDPRVEGAAPLGYVEATGVTTTDPPIGPAVSSSGGSAITTVQQHIFRHSVHSAWAYSRGRVQIGVINTGGDSGHPDLAPRLQLGTNWVKGTGAAHDNNGHGTSVAGVLGAVTDNATDVAGITWFGTVFAAKCLNRNGNGNSLEFVAAMFEAVSNGAFVLNMSLSGSGFSGQLSAARHRSVIRRIIRRVQARVAQFRARFNPAQLRRAARAFLWQLAFALRNPGNYVEWHAMNHAHVRNRLTVAAAGNSGSTHRVRPGVFADLEVAAADVPRTIAPPLIDPVRMGVPPALNIPLAAFSNRGSSVDVSAQGELVGTLNFIRGGGGVDPNFRGTSAAAPIVSGSAALFFSQNRVASRITVRGAVIDGARDGGSAVTAAGVPILRNVDATETFNRVWVTSGLWRNQTAPSLVTVDPTTRTYVSRPFLGPGVAPGLPDPTLNGNPGAAVWWFGSPLHGTYIDFFPPPSQAPLGGGVSPGIMSGSAITAPITFTNATNPVLQFKTWWEIESKDPDTHDLLEVYAADLVTGASVHLLTLNPTAAGVSASRAQHLNHASSTTMAGGAFNVAPTWRTEQVQLRTSTSTTLFGGNPFVIEFVFDSVDGVSNGWRGWVVDEVRFLDGAGLLTVPPFPANSPRPRHSRR